MIVIRTRIQPHHQCEPNLIQRFSSFSQHTLLSPTPLLFHSPPSLLFLLLRLIHPLYLGPLSSRSQYLPFFSSALEPRRFPRVDFCRGETTDRRASAIFRAYRYVIMRSPFHVRRSFFRRVHDARCTAPDLLRHPLAASVTGMYYEALADQTSFFQRDSPSHPIN